ncbi:MAG: hypothetical protein ACRCUY_05115 [Thermoguttaceae bacterium]
MPTKPADLRRRLAIRQKPADKIRRLTPAARQTKLAKRDNLHFFYQYAADSV